MWGCCPRAAARAAQARNRRERPCHTWLGARRSQSTLRGPLPRHRRDRLARGTVRPGGYRDRGAAGRGLRAAVGADVRQLLLGLTAGRWACLPCLAYFELVQPRFGEGPLEDSRPPRLANAIGTVVPGHRDLVVGRSTARRHGARVGCGGPGPALGVYRPVRGLRGLPARRAAAWNLAMTPPDGSTRPISAASTGTVRRTSSSRIRCAPSAASGSGGSEAASRRF